MLKTRYLILLIITTTCLRLAAQVGYTEVAAYTFSITPEEGTPSGHTRTGHRIEEVHGDLKSTLLLFHHYNKKLCLLTSPLGVERDLLHEICVQKLSDILDMPERDIITNSSHNHTIPFIDVSDGESKIKEDYELLSWKLGREFLSGLEKAANHVKNNLVPVSVEWGKAEENRITYNRKGIRPDGTTYFMREEDRLGIAGEGYHGVIDPEAIVVVFKNSSGKPVAALTSFTGHPVAAYNPEKLISYGQFPQAACEMLSSRLGNIPVAFVQGCAGNINAKYMLSGTFEEAEQLGRYLGKTFITATESLTPSKRTGIEWSREPVHIPLAELPSETVLKRDLEVIDDFVRRGNEGDENTVICVGMNFPLALTPPYRAKLVELVRPWYEWAMEQHQTNNLNNLPEYLPVEIVVARIGDVGFVGLPFEPFVETGLKIKKEAFLPCIMTCGYTDGRAGYIPDGKGAGDREYMSGAYRYGTIIRSPAGLAGELSEYKKIFTPPYKTPAGDECARIAISKINQFAK
ncbi:MAG: hypothetical protein PHN68_02510 [Prolixibacteraceae bacterium]|nr:hypothetical protein [Prolixibacteraceae bacterium]